jgi:hypothetical protein
MFVVPEPAKEKFSEADKLPPLNPVRPEDPVKLPLARN